jgi:hypothetical protein
MVKNKVLLPAVLGIAVIGGTLLGSGVINAQTASNGNTSLVQKVAQRFGLNQADVQAVFDQDKQEHRAQMNAKYEQRLSQLVTDGKITEAQKQLILAKYKELEANKQSMMQNMKNLTPEQRKSVMDQQRQDIQSWAQQNNIDLKYLMPMGFSGKGYSGFGLKGFKSSTYT